MNHSWKHRTFLSFANGFEYYDIAVYAAISSYAAINFFPQSAFGLYGNIFVWFPFILRFLSRPFGGLFLGHYADKYGRKSALILSSAITGTATLIMACLPNYEQIGLLAPCLFFLMQLLQAFSYGGESPTTIVFLMENANKNERARIGALIVSFVLLSVALSLIITTIVKNYLSYEQMLDFGWRIPIFIGVINLIVSFYFRMKLGESLKFKSSKNLSIDPIRVLKIFLRFAPNTILFYANALTTKNIIKNITQDPIVQNYLPIVFSVFCAFLCFLFGYIIDKKAHYTEVLKKNYIVMILFAVPIYSLQNLGSWQTLVLSQIFIAILFSISMSTVFADLFDQAGTKNKIATLGLGINLSATLIGAFTPLAVTILSSYGSSYIGLMMSIGGLCFFAAVALDKYKAPKIQTNQHA